MNKRTNWETYVYVPSQETLERRFDDCVYEINWIWNEQHRNKDERFKDELPAIWKRLENIRIGLREHYNVDIKTELTERVGK